MAKTTEWVYAGGTRAGLPIEISDLKDGDSVIASAQELGGDVTLSRIGDKLMLSRTGRRTLVFDRLTGRLLETRR